jgi:NTE family protein
VESLERLWSRFEITDVFVATPFSMLRRAVRTVAQLARSVRPGDEVVQGMVDTSAFRLFLRREMRSPDDSLPGIAENLRSGRLTAVAVTATRYSTGETTTFCAGRAIRTWNGPQRRAIAAELTLDHVMASSALPLFCPAVSVDGAWYGDGEIGLVAPLSPALHLGAGRILAVSTWAGRAVAPAAESPGHPVPAEALGALYGAVFSDRLDHDAAELERVNGLVRGLPVAERQGCREAKLMVVRPSEDLGAVACEPQVAVPRSLRFLARRLDLSRARSRDLLSVVMVERAYIARLLEIGERDGDARADEVARFLGE